MAIPRLPWTARLPLAPFGVNHAHGKTTRPGKDGTARAHVYLRPEVAAWMQDCYRLLTDGTAPPAPRLTPGHEVVLVLDITYPSARWDVDAMAKLYQDVLMAALSRVPPGLSAAERRVLRQHEGVPWDDKDVKLVLPHKDVCADPARQGATVTVDWYDDRLFGSLLRCITRRPRTVFGTPEPPTGSLRIARGDPADPAARGAAHKT